SVIRPTSTALGGAVATVKSITADGLFNSAQGKGGSGGRIDALEELHQDGVPLVGVDVSDAFLQGVELNGANLPRADFRSADIRDGSFVGSQLEDADLTSANLRHADLQKADFHNANLEDSDLFGANLGQADLTGAHLAKADLRNTDLHGAKWQEIAEIKLANVFGVRARQHGPRGISVGDGSSTCRSRADLSCCCGSSPCCAGHRASIFDQLRHRCQR